MPSDRAPSYHPPHAVTCWVDDVAVYVELPMKVGPSYICKFPLTEMGFSKALRALQELHREAPTRYGSATFELPTVVKVTRKGKPKPTAEQREAARAVLKKLGLTNG